MESEPLVTRDEVKAYLFRVSDIAEDVRAILNCCSNRRTTMAKRRKISAEEVERMRASAERGREFRKMLEERVKVDRRIAAEKAARESAQES